MQNGKENKYNVVIPVGMNPYPEDHEISAAGILAIHFSTDVVFVERQIVSKSADVMIGDTSWEIKSPTGKGKNNIQHTLKKALKQSDCIVFDARRSKVHIARIESELQRQFKLSSSMKRLLLIRKTGEAVEFTK